MRVAIDARTVFDGPRRGIGKSLLELYRHLAVRKPEWQFVMLHQRASGENPLAGLPNVSCRQVDIRGDRFNLWEQVRLPVAARAAKADVLHCPANTAPRLPLLKTVVTIHDVIPLELEGNSAETGRWGRRVGQAARGACRVLTPSQYSKQQISRRLGVAEEKIQVNPWAPDRRCRKVDDPAELARVRSRYGVPEGCGYVFGFGAEDPRKNTRRILEAWAGLPPGLRAGRMLLLVGMQAEALPAFEAAAARLMPEGGWRLHGYADEADLGTLLSGAELLCYPSLSEGFGLPVIDAFVCETPVLTSNTTSLPEVAGDAALLVDPHDVESIRTGLAELLGGADRRRELVDRGRERLKQFSWERCADIAAEALEDAAA